MPRIRRLPVSCLVLALAACGADDAAKPGAGPRGPGGPVPVVVEVVREQAWTDALRALGHRVARQGDVLELAGPSPGALAG